MVCISNIKISQFQCKNHDQAIKVVDQSSLKRLESEPFLLHQRQEGSRMDSIIEISPGCLSSQRNAWEELFFQSKRVLGTENFWDLPKLTPPKPWRMKNWVNLKWNILMMAKKIIQRIGYFIHHLRQEFGHYSNVKQNGASFNTCCFRRFASSWKPDRQVGFTGSISL